MRHRIWLVCSASLCFCRCVTDKEYWLGRWKRRDMGWHQTEVESRLIENFSGLSPTRVFVPLCGKSLDLKWLLDQGHDVVGVELSEQACREFFQENSIPFQEAMAGPFRVFRGNRITIYQGDFFELKATDLGSIGAVYDRAALIALPPDVRERYARSLAGFVRGANATKPFHFLQIVLQRTPHDLDGPPFSVPYAEVNRLYGSFFDIDLLSREQVELGPATRSVVEECVYRYRVKSAV